MPRSLPPLPGIDQHEDSRTYLVPPKRPFRNAPPKRKRLDKVAQLGLVSREDEPCHPIDPEEG